MLLRISSARLFEQSLALRVFSFLPGRSSGSDAGQSKRPGTRFILAQPYLGATAARSGIARGAERINSIFPLGEEGTTCLV